MTRSSPSTLIGPSAVLTIVVAACGAAPPVRPVAPVFDTIAPLIGSTESEDRTTYSLADGRIWQRQNDQFRVIYDMPGEETLFVAGTDPEGAYVLLVGSQDGLPAECS
jgi:hypothetical protein